MNYGNVLSESANIFWKHKVLWLFGVTLALFGQGEYGFSVNYQERYSYPVGEGGNAPNIPNPFENTIVQSFFENPVPFIIVFIILGLVWWLISNFVGWMCQGALIGMVDEIDQSGTTSFGQGWDVGKGRVKNLFLLAIIFAIPQLIVFLPALIAGFWLFSQVFDLFGASFTGNFPPPEQMEERFASIFPTFFGAFACIFPLLCIGGIVGWILGLLNKIAARSCVLENLGVMDSVKRGWNILRKNIGYTLLNWFILAVFSGIFGFAAAMPALILWIPTARAFMHNDWSSATVVTGILTFTYFVIMGAGVGGILTSFNSTLWTKLYKEFVAKESSVAVEI